MCLLSFKFQSLCSFIMYFVVLWQVKIKDCIHILYLSFPPSCVSILPSFRSPFTHCLSLLQFQDSCLEFHLVRDIYVLNYARILALCTDCCGQGHIVWHQSFEEHNFHGFHGLVANRENYVPRNIADFSKMRIRCRSFR